MLKGLVFDIREFAVHDGPGLRTTVCLKGCPLRCSWCHNPEGISAAPQIIRGQAGERTAGQWYTSAELASLLNRQAEILRNNEGGVTFSGGEPLMQAAFVAEVIGQLDRVHTVLDTSGYGSEDDFRLLASRVDLVLFDLKLIDADVHRRYTGCDNGPILRNFEVLSTLSTPYIVRVPLVPGVTDTDANLAAIAELVRGRPGLLHVELLPYNRAAGGKYSPAGMAFTPGFDETHPVEPNTAAFALRGVKAVVA
jgi:pyruvate formate lyase activating enzyme